MTKLPSSEKVILILRKNGYVFKSQKGSHQKFSRDGRVVIVPANRKEIPLGTLKSIARQSGINYSTFLNL